MNRFYIGAIHENLEEKLKKHNTHFCKGKHFSVATEDWELFLKILEENRWHS